MTMECLVNGQIIDPGTIGPPPMNYGQTGRYQGLEKVSYEYQMPLSEFLEKTQEWFEVFRIESIADAANMTLRIRAKE